MRSLLLVFDGTVRYGRADAPPNAPCSRCRVNPRLSIPKTSEVFSRGEFAFYASTCGGGKNGTIAGFLRLIVVMYAAGS